MDKGQEKIIKHTEQSSLFQDIDKMSSLELVTNINKEDQKIAAAVTTQISMIASFVDAASPKLVNGGRLFYIGAGTSGRLGILDASECPPTYGVPEDLVIGIIAGGQTAVFKAVENAEDDPQQGWKDLNAYSITDQDVVVGIAASGTTPYVIGALKACNEKNIITASISCNEHTPLSEVADYPIEVIVGPEFITGSTRMKSGTAQKMVLNMISTSLMVKLGRIKGNKMVNMQLTNSKLVERGTRMIMESLALQDEMEARSMLLQHGSVKKAIDAYQK
jgi:N-acetylmuramic acid 6-phosphate etherase